MSEVPEFIVEDVRISPDFDPQFYPTADGSELVVADAGEADAVARRKALFLSVYYRLNQAYSALTVAREENNDAAAASQLEVIQVVYSVRDQLERHYAPIGFVGEPDQDGLMTTNVAFSYSRLSSTAQSVTGPSSAFISIDLPPEIRAEVFGVTTDLDD